MQKFRYAPNPTDTPKIRQRRMTPETWKSGPDRYHHDLYYAWAKHRSQAHFRQEEYLLTWEDWKEIWKDPEVFNQRGRQPECLILTRIDHEKAWSMTNCEIITRYEQLLRTARANRGRKNKGYVKSQH